MSIRVSLSLAALALTSLGIAGTLGGNGPSAVADGPAGHCSFNLKNAWVGPLKACVSPSTPGDCEATGKKDENSDANFAAGACPTTALVGTCKTATQAMHYYEGTASDLEIGCGFQQGEWLLPGK